MFFIMVFLFTLKHKFDEAVKSRKSDGTIKSFRCKARKSDRMRHTYLYAAMTEDAAQRRRWRTSVLYPPPQGGTFYEAANFYFFRKAMQRTSPSWSNVEIV